MLGTIASRALQIPFELGVWVGLVSILLCSMLGGMRAVTWTKFSVYRVNYSVLNTGILDGK